MLLWFADLMNVTEEVTIHRHDLNRDDCGLLPDAYLHLVRKKTAS